MYSCGGEGAAAEQRALSASSSLLARPTQLMRVLGPYLSADGSISAEVELRVRAAHTGWRRLGKVWHKKIPYRVKRCSFLAYVQNACLSALEAFVLEPRHYDTLDRTLAKLCRSMSGGVAYEGPEHKQTLSTQEVLERWHILPKSQELRVRRL